MSFILYPYSFIHHNALSLFALGEVLPEFLGDERHEGVEQTQHAVEETAGRFVCRAVNGLPVGGLNHLEIPARELIGVEFVNRHQRLAQTVLPK